MDGIVIIPRALTEEVLLDAEKAVTKERGIAPGLEKGNVPKGSLQALRVLLDKGSVWVSVSVSKKP